MLGIALGCIKLSYDDFCRLTREEFHEIYRAYNEQREADYRDDWQRMRMLATISVQPHTKKKITPQQLLPFTWEKQQKKKQPILTKEEDKKRLENLLKRIKKQ